MKKKIALQWAEALESGDYQQGEGQLRNGEKFCCLGVLCNLHAIAHPEIAAQETNANSYLGWSGVLPPDVARWAGIKFTNGEFKVNSNNMHSLVSMNDGADTFKRNFKQIAEVIRENVDNL